MHDSNHLHVDLGAMLRRSAARLDVRAQSLRDMAAHVEGRRHEQTDGLTAYMIPRAVKYAPTADVERLIVSALAIDEAVRAEIRDAADDEDPL